MSSSTPRKQTQMSEATTASLSPPENTSVIIVGGGPVGLALAIDLRLHNVAVVLVERDTDIADGHPKGRANDMRTLEHYRRWGVSDVLRRQAWQTDDPRHELVIAQSLVTLPIGAYPLRYGRDVDEVKELAAEPSLSVPQPNTMRVLQARALELGALIYRGWAATTIEQDLDGVTVHLRSPLAQTDHRVRAEFLVGCDGPGSLVRKSIGISQTGKGPLGLTRSYVVRSEGYRINDMIASPAYNKLGMLLVSNSRASSIITILDDGSWGFGVFKEGIVEHDPSDEQVWAEAQTLLGTEAKIDIVSRASYRLLTRISDRYRRGRVFIAGDACHICPPTGGHNMNVGIEDAVNLAWKLAAVLQGWGGDALLDTYEAERRPVALRVSAMALHNSLAMDAAVNLFRDGDVRPSPLTAEQKAELVWHATYNQWNTYGVVLDLRYEGSAVIVADDGNALLPPAWNPTEYWNVSRPGHRAPHLWLSEGIALADRFGHLASFALVDVDGPSDSAIAFIDRAHVLGLKVVHVIVPATVASGKYNARLTLVRPDLFVCWQGDSYSDATIILDKIRGKESLSQAH